MGTYVYPTSLLYERMREGPEGIYCTHYKDGHGNAFGNSILFHFIEYCPDSTVGFS